MENITKALKMGI